VVGACGAFISALRKRAEIVFADVDRQPPKSAARPFPVGSHSFGRDVAMVGPSLERMVHANRFSTGERPTRPYGPLRPCGPRQPLAPLQGCDLGGHPGACADRVADSGVGWLPYKGR
jgi:hypothetical protein